MTAPNLLCLIGLGMVLLNKCADTTTPALPPRPQLEDTPIAPDSTTEVGDYVLGGDIKASRLRE